MIFDFLSQIPIQKLERKWQNPLVLNYVNRKKAEFPEYFKNFPLKTDSQPSSLV